jgi:hypothetical protein
MMEDDSIEDEDHDEALLIYTANEILKIGLLVVGFRRRRIRRAKKKTNDKHRSISWTLWVQSKTPPDNKKSEPELPIVERSQTKRESIKVNKWKDRSAKKKHHGAKQKDNNVPEYDLLATTSSSCSREKSSDDQAANGLEAETTKTTVADTTMIVEPEPVKARTSQELEPDAEVQVNKPEPLEPEQKSEPELHHPPRH